MNVARMTHALYVMNAHQALARAKARQRNGVRIFCPCTCDLCRAARRWFDGAARAGTR